MIMTVVGIPVYWEYRRTIIHLFSDWSAKLEMTKLPNYEIGV